MIYEKMIYEKNPERHITPTDEAEVIHQALEWCETN
jgi:hypothetical protein